MSQIGAVSSVVVPATVVETLTGNSGGPVGATANNIDILGAGSIDVAGNPGTSTLTITYTGAVPLVWTEVIGAATALAVNNGYIMNNAGGVTGTLPAVAAVGDIIALVGKGAGGWLIAQNAGQVIHFGNMDTTVGALGTLGAMLQYDCVEIICITANTDFVVRSVIGNLAVV